MKSMMFLVLFLFVGSSVMAVEEDKGLYGQMLRDCAPLFADGAACSNLAKGTRKCVRQNIDKGGDKCVALEKANKTFFDTGMNEEIIKKK
jgi:hypothetical protein